jgi:catechol 2,3-dioxygenase-like lactoylglutathione lyase family enzyme
MTETLAPIAPLALNHVGVTVPDIFGAIEWYGAVFGFNCIMGPRLLQAEAVASHETGHIFGPRFRRAYQAHLLTANGAGLELFQFVDPPVASPEGRMVYERPGPWHLCFTHPDIDAMVARIVSAKGHLHAGPFAFVPGRPWRLAYCFDPWSNTIEIMSHTYAEVFSNWPQPGMTSPPHMISASELEAQASGTLI